MKIWIDLTNSPHVNFFKPFIKKWVEEGHEIILTSRDLANTIDLIEQNGWDYSEVGGHAGKSKFKKLLYFPNRIKDLYLFLKNKTPDIGISHSSFYSPLVCRLLKVPSIYLNDNEHAKGNYLAFKFATLNILPEFLKTKSGEKKWDKKYKMVFYPGIKEGIYLSQASFVKESIDQTKKNKIFVRLEPWTAQYYSGDSTFMYQLIEKISKKNEVTILPRSDKQAEHFKLENLFNVKVSEKPIPLETIYNECRLFIGAGGSMTRELAFLGVSTLSVYQGELLEVDKYLIEHGFMEYNKNPVYSEVQNLLHKKEYTGINELIEKGNLAFLFIDKKLKKLASRQN